MADIIDFAARRRARSTETSAPNAGKHPKDVEVFEGVTLHDLWVRWTGSEPPATSADAAPGKRDPHGR